MIPLLWILSTLLALACLATGGLYLHWRREGLWWRDYARWLLEHHLELKVAATAAGREPAARPAPAADPGDDDDDDDDRPHSPPNKRWPL